MDATILLELYSGDHGTRSLAPCPGDFSNPTTLSCGLWNLTADNFRLLGSTLLAQLSWCGAVVRKATSLSDFLGPRSALSCLYFLSR